LEALCRWVRDRLGRDVPLHFTAFHPDYRMTDVPATPPATLARAREIGRLAGLNYVYTGNVHDKVGGSTHCPGCENAVIERDWYEIPAYRLSDEGACAHCGTMLAGRYRKFGKPFGAKRIPVRFAVAAEG
jgi:pyruvate formate lyase activating enzyme